MGMKPTTVGRVACQRVTTLQLATYTYQVPKVRLTNLTFDKPRQMVFKKHLQSSHECLTGKHTMPCTLRAPRPLRVHAMLLLITATMWSCKLVYLLCLQVFEGSHISCSQCFQQHDQHLFCTQEQSILMQTHAYSMYETDPTEENIHRSL